MTIEMPPFYVGQEVVAIRTHSDGDFIKGKDYTVTSISRSSCRCKHWIITIGISHNISCTPQCSDCLYKEKRTPAGNEFAYLARSFRAKIEIKEFVSMKQVSEQALETISAN